MPQNFLVSVDETPTPIRLIRNCEEVGLFEDLKHVNPFEETFRQAIDEKRPNVLLSTQKSLELVRTHDEDTLHTPNIFPENKKFLDSKPATSECNASEEIEAKDISDQHSSDLQFNSISRESKVNVSTSKLLGKQDVSTTGSNIVPKSKNRRKNNIKSMENTLDMQTIENNQKMTKLLRKICPKPNFISISTTSSPIKEQIKESLLRLRSAPNHENLKMTNLPLICIQVPTELKSVNDNVQPKQIIKRKIHSVRKVLGKTTDVNERNREAAKRYRYKQKTQHGELMERNMQLELENSRLKRELQLFKKTHENCSVTLQVVQTITSMKQ